MLNHPSHVIYFIIWRLTSLQNGCRLVIRTPFLSSEYFSSGKKNYFLAFWPNFLSSLSQGTPIGRSVTLLMRCGVSLRVNPLMLTTSNVFDFGFKDLRNSSVISSSWPWILSQNDIQCARENKSTTSGVSRNFLEFEGSFLMNPLDMVKTLCFSCVVLNLLACGQKEDFGIFLQSTTTSPLCTLSYKIHDFWVSLPDVSIFSIGGLLIRDTGETLACRLRGQFRQQ